MSSSITADGPRTQILARYTNVLFALFAYMLAIAAIETVVMPRIEAAGNPGLAAFIRADQRGSLLLAPLTLFVAAARLRRWNASGWMTWALSLLLMLYAPVGTAVFVYWVGWVRPQETAARRR